MPIEGGMEQTLVPDELLHCATDDVYSRPVDCKIASPGRQTLLYPGDILYHRAVPVKYTELPGITEFPRVLPPVLLLKAAPN